MYNVYCIKIKKYIFYKKVLSNMYVYMYKLFVKKENTM